MSDIFDTITLEKWDIFDTIEPEGDIFDRITVKEFDPEGVGYDYATATEFGGKPDQTGHWGSLDPRTGMILKGRQHPTWDLMEQEEIRRGSKIVKRGDRYYSQGPQEAPQETQLLTPPTGPHDLFQTETTGLDVLSPDTRQIPPEPLSTKALRGAIKAIEGVQAVGKRVQFVNWKLLQGLTFKAPNLIYAVMKKINPNIRQDMTFDEFVTSTAEYDPGKFMKFVGGLTEFIGGLRTGQAIGQKIGLLQQLPKSVGIGGKALETAKLWGLAKTGKELSTGLAQWIDPETDYQYEGSAGVMRDMGMGAGVSVVSQVLLRPVFRAIANTPFGKAVRDGIDKAVVQASKNFPRMMDKIRPNPHKHFKEMAEQHIKQTRGIDPKDFTPKQKMLVNYAAREGQKAYLRTYKNYIRNVPPDIIKRAQAEPPPKVPARITGGFEPITKPAPVTPKAEVKPTEKVLYHGTAVDFEKFDITKAGSIQKGDWGKGIYLESSKAGADYYRVEAVKKSDEKLEKLYQRYKNLEKNLPPVSDADSTPKYDDETIKALREVQDYAKELDKTTKGRVVEVKLSPSAKIFKHNTVDGMTDPFLAESAKAKGYDVLLIDEGRYTEEYVVLNPDVLIPTEAVTGEKIKIGDIIETPKGKAEVVRFAKDGITPIGKLPQGNEILLTESIIGKKPEPEIVAKKAEIQFAKTIQEAIDRFEDTGEIETIDDLANEVIALLEPDDVRSQPVEKAISQLADARVKDLKETGLRSEAVEIAEDNLLKVIKQQSLAPTPTEVKPEIERPKDLLGRPVLRGGAAGKQQEFLAKEDFKTLAEKERLVAEEDIEGQEKLFKEAEVEVKPTIEVEIGDEEFAVTETGLSNKQRNQQIKKFRKEIKDHPIFQQALEGIGDLPNLSGVFNVGKNEIGDVRQRFEGRPDILRKFKVGDINDTPWNKRAQELEIEGSLDDFMDLVEIFVDSGKMGKGRINEKALSIALTSGEPDLEVISSILDDLMEGESPQTINERTLLWAEENGLTEEDVSDFLIPELTNEQREQEIKIAREKDIKAEGRKAEELRAKEKLRGREQEQLKGIIARQKAAAEELDIREKRKKRLRSQIHIVAAKKGLTKKALTDLKKKHTEFSRLTSPKAIKKITVEKLEALLKAIERTRPKVVGHKKVVTPKTEKQIAELRQSLTGKGFMSDTEFQKILDKEARGKEAKFIDARKFITQKEGNEILARMHDAAQRIRVTEPVRKAVEETPDIKSEITKIEKLPKKAKDPSRLRSMRFFFQRLGEQSNQPIYEVFLDLTLEEQLRSRQRHNSTKLAEKLPDFAKIANDPEALQRVEDWIVSQSVLEDRPEFPKDITDNEIRLAKLVQASFKAYETLARAGKFFEFFDNREEIPQYLKFKQGIDKAFDVYNTKGYDALIEYLDTQNWGIVSAGYSPMESVVRKVSTNRMPDIAVGKSRIRQRGITYRKQDRDILQRWYSYMRQMDQLVHIQPRIKSLVRLINDNQGSFINARRISSVVSTYLDNLKHTNYEDGLVEEWSRRLYSQAITVRVLADPLKPLRNLAQNIAFSEDRRDFLNPLNKMLTAEDLKYLETHVHQSSVMMTDWAYVGEDPILFKNLTKWVQRKTLYPASDRLNRLISFHAKINRVRRAFAKDQPLAEKMKDARFSDMQKAEQKTALGILAKDGVDAMARYIAKVHTDNTHFLYAREQRSPAEQTKVGKIALNLALFRRAAVEKALLQLGKVFERKTGFGAKRRAASVLVTLLGMSAMVGVIWKKVTGQKYSPYSYFNFLELNFGGLEVAVIQKAEDAYNSMFDIITIDPKKRGKAIESFGTNITKVADYMIPFYDIGLRAIEAVIGSENIDRIPARKIRELIDKEYKSRGLTQIDRDLIEKIQFTFAKGGERKRVTKKKSIEFQLE